MNARHFFVIATLTAVASLGSLAAFAQLSEVITYQGYLTLDGEPVQSESRTLTFRLYEESQGGNAIWTETHSNVSVSDGVFDVQLGSVESLSGLAFDRPLWITVSLGGADEPEVAPRMPLSASPYAFRARSVGDDAIKAGENVTLTRSGNSIVISASGGGDGSGEPSGVWRLSGNAGIDADTQFLGTLDDQPVEIRVSGQRVLRAMPAYNSQGNFEPNMVAGHPQNTLEEGASGATISGGANNRAGPRAAIAGGRGNQAIGDGAAAGGGVSNRATNTYATIGGGGGGHASGFASTIAGGNMNEAGETYAAVAGGNRNVALGWASFVGGGHENQAGNGWSAVAGGESNVASGPWSVIAGGNLNRAVGSHAAVAGGRSNLASGESATVPGGRLNEARGAYSFAAGRNAKAGHPGSFVWNDGSDEEADSLFSTADHQFIIRAGGGVGIGTNAPESPLTVAGIVESIEGGFKFPDGSVQSTAATGAGGWSLTGNSGTSSETNFIGTTDAIPFDLRVNGEGALRLEPGASSLRGPNVIGGYRGNSVQAGVSGAAIGGGGDEFGGTPYLNRVEDHFGTVGGGRGNVAGSEGTNPTNATDATVAGGRQNRAAGPFSFVGGGFLNRATGNNATISGGTDNEAGNSATVGGGTQNRATFGFATVSGGLANQATASYATVAGGRLNQASGIASFAAGYLAKAIHHHSFVWSDGAGDEEFSTTEHNQFVVRATGGLGVNTNTLKPHVIGTFSRPLQTAEYQLELRNVGSITNGNFGGISFTQDPSGSTALASIQVLYHNNGLPDLAFNLRTPFTSNLGSRMIFMNDGRVRLPYPNTRVGIGVDDPVERLEVAGNIKANNVAVSSDARLKRDVTPISDAARVLDALNGVHYQWRTDDFPDRGFEDGGQYGFIAQEVQAVLPELVREGSDGMLAVKYLQVIPFLVEALKQQQGQIETLTAQVSALVESAGAYSSTTR